MPNNSLGKLLCVIARFTFIATILFSPHYAQSQIYKQSQLDELKTSLPHQKGKEKLRTLLKLSEGYIDFQLDSSKVYTDRAEKLAKTTGNEWGQYKCKYLRAKIGLITITDLNLDTKFKNYSKWFKTHGYIKDQLRCDLLRATLCAQGSDIENTNEMIDKIFPIIKSSGDAKLIAATWVLKHQSMALQNTGKKYLVELDSASFYYRKTNDSLGILKAEMLKRKYSRWDVKIVKEVLIELEHIKKWNNTVLNFRYTQFLAVHYASRAVSDSALFYLNRSVDLAKQLGNIAYESNSQGLLGGFYSRIDSLELSNEHYQKALTLIRKSEDIQHEGKILMNIGRNYDSQSENILAIKYYIQAIDLLKEAEMTYYLQISSNLLANMYVITEEYKKAEILFKDCYQWAIDNSTGRIKAQRLHSNGASMGEMYRKQNRYPEALEIIHNTIASSNQLLSTELIDLYAIEMSIHLDLKDELSAFENYNQILEKLKLIQDGNQKFQMRDRPNFHLQSGRLMMMRKEPIKAVQAFEKFLTTSTTVEISEERKLVYSLLSEAYLESGNHKLALESFKTFHAIDDSLKKINAIENIQVIQSKYEVSVKEATIQEMQDEKELKDLRLEQQRNALAIGRGYIVLLSLAILLLGFVSYWIYRRSRLKNEKKEIRLESEKLALERQNIESQKKVEIAQLKDDLFANVSHEFRTPLTLIKVPIKDYIEKAPEEDKKIFESVIGNADYLLQMIDEMLELSRMESGNIQLHPTTIDLSLFIAQLKSNFDPLFNSKEIHFKVTTSINNENLIADRNRLKMVLNNLLKNAWNHTPKDGKVELKIDQNLNTSSGIEFTVSNSVEGIAIADTDKIFDRYYRADEDKYVGNGIGLALCKQIVEMHGGAIDVDTEIVGLTSFTFFLPEDLKNSTINISTKSNSNDLEEIEYLNISEDENKPSTGTNLEKQTLLIVEDNTEMRDLLHDVLSTDYNLLLAKDGEEGESIALEKQPDLIVSDVMMPKKDGFELLESLKGNLDSSHIPIVLLTARADSDSRIHGFDYDADDYIAKPFDSKELRSRIENLLRQRLRLQTLFEGNPLIPVNKIKCSSLDAEFLDRARTIVEKNLDDGEFTVEQLCRDLALNRNSVHNKFKALTGSGASIFIRDVRVAHAAKLLLSTHSPINDVGIDTGFNSRQAFNKAFKDKFNQTPSDYRKENQLIE